jgi:predicted O-methyltransferase YrrM
VKRAVRDLLATLELQGAKHDAQETSHARKMLNLEPQTAQLLSILVRSSGSRRVLEIGTSNGYSTIWLAAAVEETGGQAISIERSADKQAMARENLARAGLSELVALVLGDATAIVRELAPPFDFIFFDADRWSAPEQLKILIPKMAPQAFIAADNALSHPEEIAGYLKAVAELDGFDHLVVPVGKGLSLAYRGSAERPGASRMIGTRVL